MTSDNLINLQPGTVIAGDYEVVKCLGAGSMGLVYACRCPGQSAFVAVKVLFPEVSKDRIATARFRNEIFASYGVAHPNVVKAYKYIRDGDLVAYTMEYVAGGDLADRLGRSRDPLSIPDIIRILIQMCAGVQAIHESGIVHRDLKPENILLTKEGDVKIADFGIARTGHGPKLTEHGGVVGTIDYVSPEYILNSQVDWRSDIYAMGILAYEMLTGESPFRGDSVYATMTKRLKTDPEPPGKSNANCPPELDRIVMRAMQRDPEARYQAAAEMQRDLQAVAEQYGYRVQALARTSSTEPLRASAALPAASHAGSPVNRAREGLAPDEQRALSQMPSRRREDASSGAETLPGNTPGDDYSDHAMDDQARQISRRPTDVIFRPSSHPRNVQKENRQEPEEQSASVEDTQILSTALDTQRMRKLHELIDHSQPWDLFDFLRLSFAILFGLCVGLVIVNYMSPDIFGGASVVREMSMEAPK